MSFSHRILVGLGLGVASGLFFGELVAPLKVVADGFVKLLQMTVLPYVVVSIIVSLGSLDVDEARRLGLRAGAVLVGLWAAAIGLAFLFPLVFPPGDTASFFNGSLVEAAPAFDFIGLYIPSNPFHSLANNIVPAVVLFSVILGLALIGVQRKAALIDVLYVVSTTIARATRFVVQLTPYGIFALAAVAAGTLNLEQLGRIQVYLITYVAISLLLSLWVLPGLVAALTPIRYRDVIAPTRDALITAFLAGDLFIVLPMLTESSKALLAKHGSAGEHAATLPDVIVPASFNFPHTGKLLSVSFILFAGWFADAAVPVARYPQLALTGLLSFFGSLNAAVPFLLDLFRIPADTFQLFLTTSVINSRFGTLAAAMHTIAVALIGSAAVAGLVRIDAKRLARFAVITVVLAGVVVGGLRVTFRTLLREDFKGAERVYGMTTILEHEPAVEIARNTLAAPTDEGPVLAAVRSRGLLRVCYVDGRLPYVFRNAGGALVGYDVELAQLLARDVEVKAQFVPVSAAEFLPTVTAGTCDIGIGGQPVTPRLAFSTRFSEPYLDETLAFIVKDHLRERFESWSTIAAATDLVIATPALPYYQRLLSDRLPGRELKSYATDQDPLDDALGFDAVALPAERGSVLTMLNPKWTVVVPQPGLVKVPIALPVARHDVEWARLVNTWIELKHRDGTLDTLYQHWILGRMAEKPAPRWSVIRNVLHWV